MTYLLDANVFIEAENRYYQHDVCPGFWDWLQQANRAGLVYSIEKVHDELKPFGDQVTLWAAQMGSALFLPPDPAIAPSLAAVSTWVQGQSYEAQAVAAFLGVADYWLVAHALTTGWKVVTEEKPAPLARKRVKVPDACSGVGVDRINTFQMLAAEGVWFVLDT
jgi:hypothetical protein